MGDPIKREDVLLAVIHALESENLKPTFHVLQRMQERKILLSDLHEAIYSAYREEHKDEFNATLEIGNTRFEELTVTETRT